tara:strand:- start:88533 stop:89210 length:678 start_codon:yes stop_codon:yes gene_type:complete
MKLSEVVPFGRSLDEYRHMFALSRQDLDKTILGVADGPASFNAELFAQGKRVVSLDPLYQFEGEEIKKQFDRVADDVFGQVASRPQDYVWAYHKNLQVLRETRTRVIDLFVTDFARGKAEGRYIYAQLPVLEFRNQQFGLALCSHFLFLYSSLFSYEFHLQSVLEMLRVGNELRIFPLLRLDGQESPYLTPLIKELDSRGFHCRLEKVAYEMQKGGNTMLKITKT